MKQLTPEILQSVAEELGIANRLAKDTSWGDWVETLKDLIEELDGQQYINFGAEVISGQDYADVTLYVGVTIPTIGWCSITFNHDFDPLYDDKLDWKDLCDTLLYCDERAKKVKAYFDTPKDQTPAPTQLNA